MSLKVNSAVIEELVEDQGEELTMKGFAELQSEQKTVLIEEHPTEEEGDREEVSGDVTKSVMEKGHECQHFLEKYHPNKTGTMLTLMNDTGSFISRGLHHAA